MARVAHDLKSPLIGNLFLIDKIDNRLNNL